MRVSGCGRPAAVIGCRPKPRRQSGCPPEPNASRLTEVEDVVEDFIRKRRKDARRHLEFYRRQKTWDELLRVAALSIRGEDGKRHGHQCRIPAAALVKAWDALQPEAFRLRRTTDFDALHDLVGSVVRSIEKIGDLAQYDISERIGAWLGLMPKRKVYLHAGARRGARAVGIRGDMVDKADFPPAFERLTAAEIEDCLCVYKEDLERIAQRRAARDRHRSGRASQVRAGV